MIMLKIINKEFQKWLTGLLFIFIIYSSFYIFFAESSYFLDIPRKIRHVIKFVSTVSVYYTGTYHLGRIGNLWMLYLWHIIHISLLFTITMIGVYTWIYGLPGYSVILLAKTFQEFLISPVLYVGMAILNNTFSEKKPLVDIG